MIWLGLEEVIAEVLLLENTDVMILENVQASK